MNAGKGTGMKAPGEEVAGIIAQSENHVNLIFGTSGVKTAPRMLFRSILNYSR